MVQEELHALGRVLGGVAAAVQSVAQDGDAYKGSVYADLVCDAGGDSRLEERARDPLKGRSGAKPATADGG